MGILIGADIVPVKSNEELFTNANVEELIGVELQELLRGANYRIFNLEVPLTDQMNPIAKNGPHLSAPTSVIHGLKAMDINLLTLGNNHIMDQDAQGLFSTLQTLDKAGIMHVGAGENIYEAQTPVFFNIKGKKYGVYACTEHEYSIAGEKQPGANPFDPLESIDHISQMKSQCEYVIVLYHGGKEYYRYPSPNLQKTCRKLIEKGADLVLCQHSHCIGCKEEYLNGTIVYGQGNFMFDRKDDEYWNTGLLINICETGELSYIPIKKTGKAVRLATGSDADEILGAFALRSEEILQPEFIEEKYDNYANEKISDYILLFRGINIKNPIYRAINKLSGYNVRRIIVSRVLHKHRYKMINYIECEAHRELFLKGLKGKGK